MLLRTSCLDRHSVIHCVCYTITRIILRSHSTTTVFCFDISTNKFMMIKWRKVLNVSKYFNWQSQYNENATFCCKPKCSAEMWSFLDHSCASLSFFDCVHAYVKQAKKGVASLCLSVLGYVFKNLKKYLKGFWGVAQHCTEKLDVWFLCWMICIFDCFKLKSMLSLM